MLRIWGKRGCRSLYVKNKTHDQHINTGKHFNIEEHNIERAHN